MTATAEVLKVRIAPDKPFHRWDEKAGLLCIAP